MYKQNFSVDVWIEIWFKIAPENFSVGLRLNRPLY